MKKHSLFKIILILIGLLVITSWFVHGRQGDTAFLAIDDVAINYVQAFYYFFDTMVFVAVIGAFYGVLNKTGAYKKLLDTITTKVKGKSKEFVIATIIIFALLASITGMTLPLLIFIPFVISIILLLGYDKLVAISSTIVATLVGFTGGIFTTFRNPSYSYGYSATTFENLTGIEQYSNLFPKILLLVLGVGFLIFFCLKHIKNVENKKVKYELNEATDVMITEVKGSYKDIKIWPMITVLSVVLVLLILGLIPWNDLFKIEVFENFHTWVVGLSIPEFKLFGLKFKEFPVFNNLIFGSMSAFGSWGTLGSFMVPIVILIFFCLLIKFIYKIKFDDAIDGFIEGVKKMLPSALMIGLVYTVLICAYNNGFIETIITSAAGTKMGLNVAIGSLISILGSLVYSDIYYVAAGTFLPIVEAVTDEALLPVFTLAFQSLYGLVSIVGPTSIMLVVALTYLDVPYTTWVKYIWRFVVGLFILIFAILLIVTLI